MSNESFSITKQCYQNERKPSFNRQKQALNLGRKFSYVAYMIFKHLRSIVLELSKGHSNKKKTHISIFQRELELRAKRILNSFALFFVSLSNYTQLGICFTLWCSFRWICKYPKLLLKQWLWWLFKSVT